jgi:hypothetical protein
MKITAQLSERGEALTERVAELVEDLDVVVASLEQGKGAARITIEGDVEALVFVAIRLARTHHSVLSITRSGDEYVAHLEGYPSMLRLTQSYVRDIEGACVSVTRA